MRLRTSEQIWTRRSIGAGVLLCILPLTGCYERVVGASGFGADSVNVYQPSVGSSSGKGDVTIQRMKVTPMSKTRSKSPW